MKMSLADKGYLSDWSSDLSAGSARDLMRPVTSVSRNAAYAYCKARGKRLPDTAARRLERAIRPTIQHS